MYPTPYQFSEALTPSRLLGRDTGNDAAIKLRVGLHSGDVVRDAGDFYGHAVTVAARVAAIAQGGEILATRLSADLAQRGSIQFGPPRAVALKGVDEPVEVVVVLQH